VTAGARLGNILIIPLAEFFSLSALAVCSKGHVLEACRESFKELLAVYISQLFFPFLSHLFLHPRGLLVLGFV
jgi:hypothetical protein